MKRNKIILGAAALCSIILLMFAGCDESNEQNIETKDWQLVWSDEFNGAAGESPDSTKWAYDIGTGPYNDGWGNAELEYYTDRTSNVSMDGTGKLAITALRESYSGSSFTSARIKTMGMFEQTYGRFEARIKTPYGPGIWPAFWLLGSNITTVGWPQCGEIDILEIRGQKPNVMNGTVHGPGYSGGASITKTFALENDRFDADFHIFAIEWDESKIDFFVDNTLYQRITPDKLTGEWVFNTPFFMILNLAVGGNYVGFPTNQTPFPQTMYVDYVRVYN